MKLFVSIFLSLIAHISFAEIDRKGNGGDMCENRFKVVRDDINTWILNGGSIGLVLPGTINVDQYNQVMIDKMRSAIVGCTSEKVYVGSAEKTCKNFVASDNSIQIICNIERFEQTSENDQYILVHHEYAGLSGFEVNSGESSNYTISNQITAYLEDQVVKKLVVKPSKDTSEADASVDVSKLSHGSQLKSLVDILMRANSKEFAFPFTKSDTNCVLQFPPSLSDRVLKSNSKLIIDFVESISAGRLAHEKYAKIHFVSPFNELTMSCMKGIPHLTTPKMPNLLGFKKALSGIFEFTAASPDTYP